MNKDIDLIIQVAKQYDIEKLILFGSRAKETHNEYSDYDILVYGNNYVDFSLYVEYEMLSLSKFDLHNANNISEDFLFEISKTGVVIYEKA